MGFSVITVFFLIFVVLVICVKKNVSQCVNNRFDDNFFVTYGNDHFSQFDNGGEIQISLDRASGAGFKSKKAYGSGYFEMKLKLPPQHSPGVVTSFYLSSQDHNSAGIHDEVDFEFLGTNGPLYTLQTNVFANDNGGREQRIHLWFDPTLAFHDYAILWNPHQIVLFVDKIPIRVFKNSRAIGGRYPSQAMVVEGSIWNGEGWASGGRKLDWSQAPFQAHYKCFNIFGCQFGNNCESNTLLWNSRDNWKLNPLQQTAYENVKKKYLYYDYCSNPKAKQHYKECLLN